MKQRLMKPTYVRLLTGLASLAIILSTPLQVLAISSNDINAIFSGYPYYDPSCSVGGDGISISDQGGSGPLYGIQFPKANPQEMVKRINKYVNDNFPASPFKGMGDRFVAAGQEYNVNPALIIAFSVKEESLGTVHNSIVDNNHNTFGITGNANGQKHHYAVANGWTSYPSFEASIPAFMDYIHAGYIDPASVMDNHRPAKTLLDLMHKYTPDGPNQSSAEQTQKSLDIEHKILDGISTDTAAATPSNPSNPATQDKPFSNDDLKKIAEKYGLHSTVVQKLGGDAVATYQPDSPPDDVASVMKLVIVDVFLHTNPNLGKTVTVSNNEIYQQPGAGTRDNPKAGQTLTLKDILIQTLMNSSDTDANILTHEIGGPSAVTQKAHALGYKDTNINRYYNANPTGSPNKTTARDISSAMNNIYSGSGNSYAIAQDALRNGPTNFGIDAEATKWGGDSKVTAMSAVMALGNTKYIVTIYLNKGHDATTEKTVRDATNDIVGKLKPSETNSDTTPVDSSASDCSVSDNGGATAGANGFELSGANAMRHFHQCDAKWTSKPYGDGKNSICMSGCGITSAAMVVDTLAGKNETPATLADKYGNTYHDSGGTSWGLWPVLAKDYGLHEADIGEDLNKATATIKNGGLVVISVNRGYFTSVGHFMVIRAVDGNGNYFLADPNGPGNKKKGHDTEGKAFSADFLRSQGSLLHLWAFTK